MFGPIRTSAYALAQHCKQHHRIAPEDIIIITTTNTKQLLSTVATEVLPTLISEFTDQETVLFSKKEDLIATVPDIKASVRDSSANDYLRDLDLGSPLILRP